MSTSTAPDRAAFPVADTDSMVSPGFTAREHAAIALRVPDSGNDWLDKMIRTAQRNDLAKEFMGSMISNVNATGAMLITLAPEFAKQAAAMADAMLSGAATPTGE